MLSISSSLQFLVPPWRKTRADFWAFIHSNRRTAIVSCGNSSSSSSSMNEDSASIQKQSHLDFDPSKDLFGLEVDLQPRNNVSDTPKPRSWFGPNGQYIREFPCPSCRGRGYTPCTECGVERSRLDCSQCSGKGLMTCQQCLGDCVIWEESIDERPWERARSSSPLKVKEDDEVDKLDIKLDAVRKSKRVYQSPTPEVGLKISRSLRSLNAKTGLFSKLMKIIHRDPTLHAQRVAAIKKTKGTAIARKEASEAMKGFFRNPENRLKRSIAMKGVKFYCGHCREEGHRRFYCPALRDSSGARHKFRCRLCGERGHNRRTCHISRSSESSKKRDPRHQHCSICGQRGHNCRTCPDGAGEKAGNSASGKGSQTSSGRTYSCSFCMEKGHNIRTCSNRLNTLKL
ncbi:hypothetical protein AAC387_Pa03g1251 [Persea americana]